MKLSNRAVHRDIAYFFLGLIISFSISGIMLNHRRVWNPTKYTSAERAIAYSLSEKEISDQKIEEFLSTIGVEDVLRRYTVNENVLKISLVNNDITLNLSSGNGEVITYRKTPLISQMYTLHRTTSDWWIYYSDAFGIGMLVLAFTGLFMYPKGSKNGFRSRGWKLSLIGIIFPLIFLVLLA